MIKWIKKITGLAAIEAAAIEAEKKRLAEEALIQSLEHVKQQAERELEKVKEQEELARLSPKTEQPN